jgi:hypothetical protein
MRLSLEQPFLFANTMCVINNRLNQRHFEDKAL